MNKEMDYDLTRNDKVYELKIPDYIQLKDVVFYNFELKDLLLNKKHCKLFRYSDLKEIHEKLGKL